MKLRRRDLCYAVAMRAAMLPQEESARAWQHLAIELEAISDSEIPKFQQILRAIRAATIKAKNP